MKWLVTAWLVCVFGVSTTFAANQSCSALEKSLNPALQLARQKMAEAKHVQINDEHIKRVADILAREKFAMRLPPGKYRVVANYGTSMTLSRPGSRRCSRSNHAAPSSSGATALISGATLISPVAIAFRHSGYSPHEAHEP